MRIFAAGVKVLRHFWMTPEKSGVSSLQSGEGAIPFGSLPCPRGRARGLTTILWRELHRMQFHLNMKPHMSRLVGFGAISITAPVIERNQERDTTAKTSHEAHKPTEKLSSPPYMLPSFSN